MFCENTHSFVPGLIVRTLVVLLLLTLTPGSLAWAGAPAREQTGSGTWTHWDIKYDIRIIHRVQRDLALPHFVTITYDSKDLAPERVHESDNDPPFVVNTPNGPRWAGLRQYSTRIPAQDLQNCVDIGNQEGCAVLPTVMLAYSLDNELAAAGGGAVQFAQAITRWDVTVTNAGQNPVHFQPTPVGGDTVPRLDIGYNNRVEVCYFGADEHQPNVLVMADAPGTSNDADGTEVGLLLNAKKFHIEGISEVRDDILLYSRINVDSSPRHDGSAFVPFFGINWGVHTSVKVVDKVPHDTLLNSLDSEPVEVTIPPNDRIIEAAIANGEFDGKAFFQVRQ